MYLCKSGFINEFKDKINCKSQKLQIVTSRRINSTRKINSTLNNPNKHKINSTTSRITFDPLELKPNTYKVLVTI